MVLRTFRLQFRYATTTIILTYNPSNYNIIKQNVNYNDFATKLFKVTFCVCSLPFRSINNKMGQNNWLKFFKKGISKLLSFSNSLIIFTKNDDKKQTPRSITIKSILIDTRRLLMQCYKMLKAVSAVFSR